MKLRPATWRPFSPWLACGWAVCWLGAGEARTAEPKPAALSAPNVLFVMTDQQRFDTIGALGNKQIRTPNLDRLVRRYWVSIAAGKSFETNPPSQ